MSQLAPKQLTTAGQGLEKDASTTTAVKINRTEKRDKFKLFLTTEMPGNKQKG